MAVFGAAIGRRVDNPDVKLEASSWYTRLRTSKLGAARSTKCGRNSEQKDIVAAWACACAWAWASGSLKRPVEFHPISFARSGRIAVTIRNVDRSSTWFSIWYQSGVASPSSRVADLALKHARLALLQRTLAEQGVGFAFAKAARGRRPPKQRRT